MFSVSHHKVNLVYEKQTVKKLSFKIEFNESIFWILKQLACFVLLHIFHSQMCDREWERGIVKNNLLICLSLLFSLISLYLIALRNSFYIVSVNDFLAWRANFIQHFWQIILSDNLRWKFKRKKTTALRPSTCKMN